MPIPAIPRSRAPIALALFALATGVFLPALSLGFVEYDDPDYVTANPRVREGLSLAGLGWALRSGHAGNWFPLTWASHMLDVSLWGLDPRGHHLSSVLLHALSAALLFLALARMTGERGRPALVAALFAVHPLRVESVAWIAERKDVLAAFFFALTLWLHARRAERPGWRAGWPVLAVLALGLMSKQMLVSLPLVLLLLDFWPLGRQARVAPGRLVAEKLPLLALAAGASAVAYHAQQAAGAVSTLAEAPWGERVRNAAAAIWIYPRQMLWPTCLSPFYPRRDVPAALAAAAVLGLVVALALAWRLRRRHPALLVGALWYLVMLVPVLGLIQVGDQAHADRYTYLPGIGLLIALVFWLPARALGALALAGLLLVPVTLRQIGYWRDDRTLFGRALACDARNHVAHHGLAVALARQGEGDAALGHFHAALRLRPAYAEARHDLALLLAARGDLAAAQAELETLLRLTPGDARGDRLLRELRGGPPR